MPYDFSSLSLDLRDETPLSDQVAAQIRRDILSGQIEPGTRLPTVRQLAQRLRINFNTVARAYRALDSEGLILSRQGQGSFVVESLVSAEGDVPANLPAEKISPPEDREKAALFAQKKMDLLVNDIEKRVRAAGFEMAAVIAYIQSKPSRPLISPRLKPRRRRIKKNALARMPILAAHLRILAGIIPKRSPVCRNKKAASRHYKKL